MARRKVTRSGKDKDGDITRLCNPAAFWSPRSKPDAISDIENGTNEYYVEINDDEVDIHVIELRDGTKYLRTDPDKTLRNNLDELPDC